MFNNLCTTTKPIPIIFRIFNWVGFAVFNDFALSLGQNRYISILKNNQASHNLYTTITILRLEQFFLDQYCHCHCNAKAHSNAKHNVDILPPKLFLLRFLF